jgi:hypothetical protein
MRQRPIRNLFRMTNIRYFKKVVFLTVLVFLVFIGTAFSQKIYVTEWKSEADYLVYVTEWKSEANVIAYITKWKSNAKPRSGIWYFTEWKSEADIKIYYTSWKSEASLIVYFTKWQSEAQWDK